MTGGLLITGGGYSAIHGLLSKTKLGTKMNIKSDAAVAQRWQTQNQIGNFEADLSMMVSRPYEAN